jgi:AcrR family transcriptional regulator
MRLVSTSPAWKARPAGAGYDATRARLVDAAEAVVREDGVNALRLDSVADSVGLHRSSVYRYFDSKEELITAVLVQATLRIGGQVIEEVGESAPPESLLVDGITTALAAIAVDPVHQALMAPAASEAMARIAGAAITEAIRPLVEPMFTAAATRGVLRKGVTPDDAIRWLQIVVSGLIRTPNLVPDDDKLRDLLRLMLVPALIDRG